MQLNKQQGQSNGVVPQKLLYHPSPLPNIASIEKKSPWKRESSLFLETNKLKDTSSILSEDASKVGSETITPSLNNKIQNKISFEFYAS